MWYAIVVAIRNLLYDCGLKKIVRPDVPTIGIGNLRMGGTGKTPHTEYLVNLFDEMPVALLSRGYGRKSKGFLTSRNISSDPRSNITTMLGDEPAMMARKFPSITVAVCEDRVEGVLRLMQSSKPPHIVLLDDVFQHRSIKPSAMILLTEYNDPFFSDFILPFGNLREFRIGRKRADIIVVTKCPNSLTEKEKNEYRNRLKLKPYQYLFFSRIEYSQPVSLFNELQWQPVNEVLLITGIAHPDQLKHHLEKKYIVSHIAFQDHHNFSVNDCKKIINKFKSLKNTSKAIVTTEKDALRLLAPDIREMLKNLPFFYIPIHVSFLEGKEFENTIKKFV